MADHSVAGLDLVARKVWVAAKSQCASQMRIAAMLEMATPGPVGRPSIVPIILLFILSRNWLVGLNWGTFFDLLPGQIHDQTVALFMKIPESRGRDQHQTP